MWASAEYTTSSTAPAIHPARMVYRTTDFSSVTPRFWMFRAMMMPKFKAAMVSMVW